MKMKEVTERLTEIRNSAQITGANGIVIVIDELIAEIEKSSS